MAKFRRDAAEHDGRHFAIRYETLLQDAAGEMARLFQWLGCDASEATVAAVVSRNAFAVASGGRHPGQAHPQSFLRKGIPAHCKNHFDPDCNRPHSDLPGHSPPPPAPTRLSRKTATRPTNT